MQELFVSHMVVVERPVFATHACTTRLIILVQTAGHFAHPEVNFVIFSALLATIAIQRFAGFASSRSYSSLFDRLLIKNISCISSLRPSPLRLLQNRT